MAAGKFRALLVSKDDNRQSVALTELTDSDLMGGDVTVEVEHSTVNYKDGLAITAKAPIIRKFPLIPGIDLAGKVLSSEDPRFQAGDRRAERLWHRRDASRWLRRARPRQWRLADPAP